MGPSGNREQGEFEGKVTTDLQWIKENISAIQKMCQDRGLRLGKCEASLCAMSEVLKKQEDYIDKIDKYDERIRSCEHAVVQTRTFGSIILLAWGFVSQYIGDALFRK